MDRNVQSDTARALLAVCSQRDDAPRGRFLATEKHRLPWPAVSLTTWTDLLGHRPSELSEFDLLFVGGGNTFDLLKHVAEQDFTGPVRQFVEAGGSYYGGSAGAVLASGSIESASGYDENTTDLTDLTGLGLVPGVMIIPHYTDREEPTAVNLNAVHKKPVLGIPETAGIMITPHHAKVVGVDPAHLIDGARSRRLAPGAQITEVASAVTRETLSRHVRP
jgi:dipeptidase E